MAVAVLIGRVFSTNLGLEDGTADVEHIHVVDVIQIRSEIKLVEL